MNTPSPFYAQLEPNVNVVLEYPCVDDVDFTKLQFNSVGEQAGWEAVDELVALVDLDGGLFHLAEKMDGPFSALPMGGGDEFYALESGPGRLRFQRMDSPQRFSHLRLLLSGPFEPECKASELIHRHGEGWEVVAGGMLTATVPVEKEKGLVQDLREENAFPAGLARTP